MRFSFLIRLVLVTTVLVTRNSVADAQTQLRHGVLLLNQARELATRSTTLSGGKLADLQTDPNFQGDFQFVVNEAATLLNGYTVVQRGGFFPENRGIPRKQQLTVREVIYTIYSLPNSTELFLYRTPTENTAAYFIRRKG